MQQQRPASDPLTHTAEIKAMLSDAKRRAREGVSQVDDPKAKALFETTAEVLQGLITAFEHYENKSEEAWR